MKYFIYCRRSQDREDRQTLSIESQKRELLEFSRKNSLDIVEVISEDKSAYKRGRPKFGYMMDEIEKGTAQGILTWHLTRLARNSADGGLLVSFMDEGKIKEIRTPEKTYINTGDDKFMMNIHMSVAKKSSDDTSAFVKNNTKTKLERGEFPGVVPYGYLNLDINGIITGKRFDRKKQAMLEDSGRTLKRIEQDPIEAPIIRKLIDLALTGAYSVAMLQEEAYKLGLKGKVSKKRITAQSLIDVLSNIFYTGKFNYAGKVWDGIQEPLMTKDEYSKIQKILSENSRPHRRKNEYLFSMLAECPGCGGLLSGDLQKGTKYYRCSRAKGKNATCSHTEHIREDDLEKKLQETLLKVRLPKKLIDWALKYLGKVYEAETTVFQQKTTLLHQDLGIKKAMQKRLTTRWLSEENAQGDILSDEEYKEQKSEIQKEIDEINEKLKDTDSNESNWLIKCEDFFQKARNLNTEYEIAEPLDKKILLQSAGARFIRKNGKMAIKLEEPYSFLIPLPEFKKSSEPLATRFNKPQNQSSEANFSKWLPGLDSNQ